MISAADRSEWATANAMHRHPPSDTPNRAAVWEPAASITARISSIRSVRPGGRATGSDNPVPRLSKKITRVKAASRRRNRARYGSSQASSMWEMKPGTNTRSTEPSPKT